MKKPERTVGFLAYNASYYSKEDDTGVCLTGRNDARVFIKGRHDHLKEGELLVLERTDELVPNIVKDGGDDLCYWRIVRDEEA